MPEYKVIERHKHWHRGRLYEAGSTVNLTEEQAEKIAHKLERVDGTFSPSSVEEEKKEETVVEPEAETEVEPVTTAEVVGVTGDISDEAEVEKVEESSESLPHLKMVHVADGKYNVMRGDVPINDVPLSKDEVRSLMENN